MTNPNTALLVLLLLLLAACYQSSDSDLPASEATISAAIDTESSPEDRGGNLDARVVLSHANDERYVGLEYEEVPRGLNKLGGFLLGSYKETPKYLLSWIVDDICESKPCPQGTTSMLWFEEMLVEKPPRYRVLDAVGAPGLLGLSEQILSTCEQGEDIDPEIVAIGKFDLDQSRRLEIIPAVQAWRLNRRTGAIEEISAEGVQCLNPAYGI